MRFFPYALMLVNAIFRVPQLSVKLDSISPDQMKMTRFWMNWWNANSEVLLSGKLLPHKPGALFPLVTATNESKTIAAAYEDVVVQSDEKEYRKIDIENARPGTELVLRFDKFRGMWNSRYLIAAVNWLPAIYAK